MNVFVSDAGGKIKAEEDREATGRAMPTASSTWSTIRCAPFASDK